ncbi:PmoA family protein [Paractinoplanes durhamensis]|uniref:Oxidoreductase n=1 Tax=Paractinoplanes durhamensis TaxID=113563 RepID=A0ABQ3ZB99_9ACTN|nr:PmoA family protein [Actinoplanes durhamensis]GIE07106.1 oxidoreductase [Actinoplanes durhamensis]
MTGDAPAVFRLAGRPVAEYTWAPDLPVGLAPRPYLHPVRTLGGTVVTELTPPSHRHHLGVSVAVAEVDGGNFWGGRTFIAGHGPAWLDNQGSQRHVRWLRRTDTELSQALRWDTIDGASLLAERRIIEARPLDDDAWALDFTFTLANVAERDLPIRSPAAHGRSGAGYGGFFWRAPSPGACRVSADVHGHRAPWVSVGGPAWTLVFAGGDPATRADRWFVRTRDYLGVGSALAWDAPLVLAAGESVTRRVVTVVADGELPDERAAAYASQLVS